MNVKGGYLSHHDYRKLTLLQSMTGKVINNEVIGLNKSTKENLSLELQQLRLEYNMLYQKLIDLDNKILTLEVKINT